MCPSGDRMACSVPVRHHGDAGQSGGSAESVARHAAADDLRRRLHGGPPAHRRPRRRHAAARHRLDVAVPQSVRRGRRVAHDAALDALEQHRSLLRAAVQQPPLRQQRPDLVIEPLSGIVSSCHQFQYTSVGPNNCSAFNIWQLAEINSFVYFSIFQLVE